MGINQYIEITENSYEENTLIHMMINTLKIISSKEDFKTKQNKTKLMACFVLK